MALELESDLELTFELELALELDVEVLELELEKLLSLSAVSSRSSSSSRIDETIESDPSSVIINLFEIMYLIHTKGGSREVILIFTYSTK
jgi:hypothetical protein